MRGNGVSPSLTSLELDIEMIEGDIRNSLTSLPSLTSLTIYALEELDISDTLSSMHVLTHLTLTSYSTFNLILNHLPLIYLHLMGGKGHLILPDTLKTLHAEEIVISSSSFFRRFTHFFCFQSLSFHFIET